MKLVYKAEDGTEFSTEAECEAYEMREALDSFIDCNIGMMSEGLVDVSDVKTFIEKHIDEIIRIVKGDAATSDDGWISNESNSSRCHPKSLTRFDIIEVKFRNGTIREGIPDRWTWGWKSTDNHELDIVAYRIVK